MAKDESGNKRPPDGPEKTGPKPRSPTRKLDGKLVALGTAAVVTVYTAGYVRTRSAAQAFAAEASVRRPPAQTIAAAPPVQPAASAESAAAPVSSAAGAAPAATIVPAAPALPKLQRVDSLKPAQPPAPKPVGDPVIAAVADSSQSAARSPKYKDGLFFGWGTSRHGDIQAAVEVKAGRINSAFISECLTQYSCSLIIHLPPQVAIRQSTDIDYVSGATHSVNALYYALVDALAKAK